MLLATETAGNAQAEAADAERFADGRFERAALMAELPGPVVQNTAEQDCRIRTEPLQTWDNVPAIIPAEPGIENYQIDERARLSAAGEQFCWIGGFQGAVIQFAQQAGAQVADRRIGFTEQDSFPASKDQGGESVLPHGLRRVKVRSRIGREKVVDQAFTFLLRVRPGACRKAQRSLRE